MSKATSREVRAAPEAVEKLTFPIPLNQIGGTGVFAPQHYQLGVNGFNLDLTIPGANLRRRVVENENGITVYEGVTDLPLGYDPELVQTNQMEVLFLEPDGNLPISESLSNQATRYLESYYQDRGYGLNHVPHGFEHEVTYTGNLPADLRAGLVELSTRQLELSEPGPVAEGWLRVKQFLREKFFPDGEISGELLVNFASVPPDQFDWEMTTILGPEESPIYGPYVKAITNNLYKMIQTYKDYRPEVTQRLWGDVANFLFGEGITIDDCLNHYGDMRMWVMNAKHDSIPLLRTENGLPSEKFAMNLANLAMHFRTTLNAGSYSGPIFGGYHQTEFSDLREVQRMLMPTSMPSDKMFSLTETTERGRLLSEQMLAHVNSGFTHTADRGAGECLVNNKQGEELLLPSMHGDYRVRVTRALTAKAENGFTVADYLKEYHLTHDPYYLTKITEPARFEYTSAPSTPDYAYKAQGSAACLELFAAATALAIEEGYSDVFSWLHEQEEALRWEGSLFSPDLITREGLTDKNWAKAQLALAGQFDHPELQLEFKQMKQLINLVALKMNEKGLDNILARAHLAYSYVDSLQKFKRGYYRQFSTAKEIFSDYYNYRLGNWGELLRGLFEVYGDSKQGLSEVLSKHYGMQEQDLASDSTGTLVLKLNDAFVRREVHRN